MEMIKKKLSLFYYNFIQFPKYVLFHPFDGFDDFKRNKKAKTSIAVLFIFLFALFRIIQFYYQSMLVNDVNKLELNSLREILLVAVVVFLFTIGNWAVTTLMEGKGSYKEIFQVTGYSLFPIVVIGIPMVFLSNIFTLEEIAIYNLIIGMAYVATGWMLFMGILNIHEYGLFKTIWSLLLTVLAMAIMIFFAILFFSLIQEIVSFFRVLWQEISLRS